MSTPRDLERSRAPEKVDVWIACGLFLLVFAVAWATEKAVGFPRDESFYFYAGHDFARWVLLLLHHPSEALRDSVISQWTMFGYNHEHPMAMKELFGLSFLLFHHALGWLRPATAYRIPTFLVAGAVAAVLHLYGSTLYNRRVGLFAALSFFLVPRQFFHAHIACFDLPVAAVWLLVVWAFWRAMTDKRWWLWCGLAFGLAVAVKHNNWFLPFVLGPFALARAVALTRGRPELRAWVWRFLGVFVAFFGLAGLMIAAEGPTHFVARFEPLSPQMVLMVAFWGAGAWVIWRLRQQDLPTFRALAPIWAISFFGPVIFYLHWPWMWAHPVSRTIAYFAFHLNHVNYAWFYLGTLLREPPFPLAYVFVVTALTVPVSLLVPMTTGLLVLWGRLLASARRGFRHLLPSSGELLVGVNALAAILIISDPSVPHFGGVKHWFASMCFLALLAGQAVVRAADAALAWWKGRSGTAVGTAVGAWNRRGLAITGGLFALLMLPAAMDTWHVHPYGTSAYAELAGGIPGAATLGMQRQFWSSNVTAVLPWINRHAPPGARVFLHQVTGLAFRDYQRNGMLRPDLVPARGPRDAQIAAYQYHQEFREREMEIWQDFGTTKPVTGLYLDETPQIVVYQRP